MPRTAARPGVLVLVCAAIAAACAPGAVESAAPVVSNSLSNAPIEGCPLSQASSDRRAFDAAGEMLLVESSGAEDPSAGGGRARICLPALGLELDVKATCNWRLDRSGVRSVSAGIDRVGGRVGDVALSIGITPGEGSGRRLEVLPETTGTDVLGVYRDGPDSAISFEVARDQGAVAFEGVGLVALPGRASEPLGALGGPEALGGVVRWTCDEPPPLPAGRAAGSVEVSIDGIEGRAFAAEATCRWATSPRGQLVTGVDSLAMAVTADRQFAIALHRDPRPLLPADPEIELAVWVSIPDGGRDATSSELSHVLPLGVAANFATGSVRFRDLTLDVRGDAEPPGQSLDGTPDTRVLGGWLRWACAPPAVPPVDGVIAGDRPDGDEREGTIRLELGSPLDEALEFPVTCRTLTQADGASPPVVSISRATGETRRADERLIAVWESETLVLFRFGPGGHARGEYVASGMRPGWQSRDEGWLKGPSTLELESRGPAYTAFDGNEAARSVPVTIELDCAPR